MTNSTKKAAPVALVTGASRGIGAAISQSLEGSGWTVIAPTRTEMDLSRPESIEDFLGTNLGDMHIQGIVLNAGINNPKLLSELSSMEVDRILQVNLQSSFRLVSALVPHMVKSSFGRIVAISSAYANRARAGRSAYSASKAGLEALIRTIAIEYANSGLVANSVCPGFVDTDLTRANNSKIQMDEIVSRIPIGRLASVEEVGRLVDFLMSPDNAYITGQTIAIDGGLSCT